MLNLKMTKREFIVRLIVFFIGLAVLSLGIAMIIEANLGVSGWDVLHIGLYKTFGLTIGTWSQIVGLIVIFLTLIIDRKILSLGTVLNMIVVGLFIDLFLYLLPTGEEWLIQYLFLFLGIIIMGIGAGIYISAKLGPGPRDSLMIAITQKYKLSVSRVKTVMELSVMLVGYLLGGPVFVGTVIISVLIGPIMQYSLKWWEKRLEPLFIKVKQNSDINKIKQISKEEIL